MDRSPARRRPSIASTVAKGATAVACALALIPGGPAAAAGGTAATGSSAPIPAAAARLPSLDLDMSVLGSPRRTVKGVRRAGVVEVRRGTTRWLLTSATVGRPLRTGALFGTSVVTGQVTPGDVYEDLVIGAPGWAGGRGAVVVVPDFGRGLEPGAARWLPTGRSPLRAGDALGTSAGVVTDQADLNDDGVPDARAIVLAGAPGRDLPGARDAGVVLGWLFPPTTGVTRILRPSAPTTLVQGRGGLLDRAEHGDRFGSVMAVPGAQDWLSSDVVLIGVPDEDVAGKPDAGAVVRLRFARGVVGSEFLRLGAGLPLTPHAGDRLGAAVASGATWYRDPRTGAGRLGPSLYGAPGLDSHGIKDAGAVVVERLAHDRDWLPVRGPVPVLTENSPGIPGAAERGDRFGAALAAMWTYDEGEGTYLAQVAVGVPREDSGRRKDCGSVVLIPGRFLDSSLWDGPEKASVVRARGLSRGDRFGERLALVRTDDDENWVDDLLIGAPGEDRPKAKNAGRFYSWSWAGAPTVHVNGVSRSERFGGL